MTSDIKYPIKSSLFQDVLSRTAFKRLVAKVPNLFRLLMSPSWVLIVKVFIGNILLELDLQDSKAVARQKKNYPYSRKTTSLEGLNSILIYICYACVNKQCWVRKVQFLRLARFNS